MKKLFPVILACLTCNLYSQEKELFTIDAKEVSSQTVPSEVLMAVEKDFPGNDVIDYYLLDGQKVNSEWAVSGDDNLGSNDQPDHFTVMLKAKKGGYVYGLYNKAGDLQKMKVLAKDFELPSTITTVATSGDYSGYATKSDKYVKVVDKKKNKE